MPPLCVGPKALSTNSDLVRKLASQNQSIESDLLSSERYYCEASLAIGGAAHLPARTALERGAYVIYLTKKTHHSNARYLRQTLAFLLYPHSN